MSHIKTYEMYLKTGNFSEGFNTEFLPFQFSFWNKHSVFPYAPRQSRLALHTELTVPTESTPNIQVLMDNLWLC